MPDERIIGEIEQILTEIVELGAEKERTKLVPNLLVTNASPAGLTNFIVVRDDRDGDNILATKVPGIVYSTNDLVNVLFVKGGEAIAFQQGSASSSSGIWGIVLGSSTDIFYNAGDVVIGKTSAPDATLEILDTAQSQLRLTHTDATKFVDFTLDTNHDLTIDPSSTGQIILATDDVVIQEDLIHSGDTDTKIIFTDDDIEFQAGALSMLKLTETAQDLITLGPGSGDVDIDFNGDMFIEGATGQIGIGTNTIPHGGIGGGIMAIEGANASISVGPHIQFTTATDDYPLIQYLNYTHDNIQWQFDAYVDGALAQKSSDAGSNFRLVKAGNRFRCEYASGNAQGASFSWSNGWSLLSTGLLGIGIGTGQLGKLHVDQASTTAAIPTLVLDQADLSEEFVNFVSTIGAGNPIDTAAIGTYYGKIRVSVNGTFKYIALYNS